MGRTFRKFLRHAEIFRGRTTENEVSDSRNRRGGRAEREKTFSRLRADHDPAPFGGRIEKAFAGQMFRNGGTGENAAGKNRLRTLERKGIRLFRGERRSEKRREKGGRNLPFRTA